MKRINLSPLNWAGKTASVSLATVAIVAPSDSSAQPERPNIVFIMADDLGPDGFGSYGSELYSNSTPRIDALATNGMRFTRAYCTGICSPTRAQILTGQYPFRNGVLDIDSSNYRSDPNKPNLTKVLSDAGYTTGGSGKAVNDSWHTSNHMQEYLNVGTGSYWGYKPFNYAFNSPTTIDPQSYSYVPDALQDFALDFIDRHYPRPANGQKPFYLYYSLINPHTEIEPTPFSDQSDIDADHLGNLYRDNIEYIDWAVGGIVDRLSSLGILDTTLLIITGDNGSLGGERGYTYKSKIWDPGSSSFRSIDGSKADRTQNREGTALVPFIIHWPDIITTPSVETDLIDFTDLLPTYADVAGASIPTNWVLDGQSLAPLLRGEVSWTPREWIFHQIQNNWCVRGTDYRLNRDGRFFDMSDAPFSMTEVTNPTSQQQAIRDNLQTVLDGFDPVNGPSYEGHQDNVWKTPAWTWKASHFNWWQRFETAIAGDEADPDGDGVKNIFERAFGWDPNVGTNSMPKPFITNGTLQVQYPQTGSEVEVIVDVTDSLTNTWDSSTTSVEILGVDPKTATDKGTGSARFMRIRAERTTNWDEP